jgi:hypothetical protein
MCNNMWMKEGLAAKLVLFDDKIVWCFFLNTQNALLAYNAIGALDGRVRI